MIGFWTLSWQKKTRKGDNKMYGGLHQVLGWDEEYEGEYSDYLARQEAEEARVLAIFG